MTSPLRIGFVTGEFPPLPGGVGDYTRELARALVVAGVEVHVITDKRCRGAVVPEGVQVHSVIGRWSFPALFSVRQLARTLKLDLLNIQYQAAAYGLSTPIHFLPAVAGIKTVVTFHDLRIPYLFPKAGGLRVRAINHLAQSAQGVIVIDPDDEAELQRRNLSLKHLQQIHIGSNIAPAPPIDYDRAEFRRVLGVSEREFLIGYFGFLNHSKGGDTLIQALAFLADRQSPVKLVLIGGQAGASDPTDAKFGAELERMIGRYGVENKIIRTGFVNTMQVSAHLLACDALVLPYRDGVSLRRGSLMAALAHGCAIITTTPRHPLSLLRDGENIRLVPPETPQAIVLAVSGLLDAPELRARLGEGAHALAQHFTWDKIAAQTLKLYRTVVELG